MRPSNKSRSRNKTGNNGSHNNNNNNNQRRNSMGNIINRVFESAGPDGKVRGTPQQIIDKYQALARDAQVAGDRVAAESYLQYSEHYSRLLGEAQRAQQEARASQDRDNGSEREDGGFEPRRQPQQNMASGLTTIDADDSFDAGPIDTPEGRRGYEENGFARRDREPRPNNHAQAPRSSEAQTVPAEAQTPSELESPAEQPAAVAPSFDSAPESAPSTPEQAPTEQAPTEQQPAPAVAEPEFQLAEPQAEPAKKPRARRRKTQPAVAPEETAVVDPAPEPAQSE